jgi:hypothetical protein
MLEQTEGSPLAPREQLTQSSVHRLQFGGPDWIEKFFGVTRGGMGRSAAAVASSVQTTRDSAIARRLTM